MGLHLQARGHRSEPSCAHVYASLPAGMSRRRASGCGMSVRYGRRSGEEDLDITLEIGIAQGFKYAANRRPANPDTRQELRMHLAEQALEMLKGTEYWFSQLTLIQALCLLSLSDEARHPANKHGAKPEAIVQHWLDVAGRDATDPNPHTGMPGEPHPFVREAAQLAVLALKTAFPQRYLWIDESGVVGRVGSRKTSDATTYRKHRLWIPPSAGWTALDGRAQQLVADVLLLLNLADRGDQPPDSERRLKRSNRHDLPPCITRYRPSLDPGLTVGEGGRPDWVSRSGAVVGRAAAMRSSAARGLPMHVDGPTRGS